MFGDVCLVVNPKDERYLDIIGKEKIAKCQKIADDLNVVLRVRPFEE